MNWDHVALWLIGVCGVVGFGLGQLRDLLLKFREVVEAWRDLCRSMKTKRDAIEIRVDHIEE